MTTQLLIYQRAVPVSQKRHGDWSVKAGADYAFAKHVNSVPLMAIEFPSAAPEYPVVFAGRDEAVMPVVILGVRERENRYLADAGTWRAKYVPAFLRRYPFVFSSSEDGNSFALCIDEEFKGCNQEGRGERLFDAEGAHTQYLRSVLEFLKSYQAQFRRTQVFCEKLKALELLEPMQAQLTLGSGEQALLAGFLAVNRQKLKALSGEQLAELARSDELELVYQHLQSLRNLSQVAQRTTEAPAQAAEASTDQAPGQDPTPEVKPEAQESASGGNVH